MDFSGAFTGVKGNKEKFKKKLLEEFDKNVVDLETFDELKEKAATILESEPIERTSIPSINFIRITEIESDPIWQRR
ncbi:MAG: hypothetical protein IPG67_11320 [Acidobacteria bacterium]|nr:hypothetical protein [Acidobacteriota bacterium]